VRGLRRRSDYDQQDLPMLRSAKAKVKVKVKVKVMTSPSVTALKLRDMPS